MENYWKTDCWAILLVCGIAGGWRSYTVKVAEVVFFLSFINWKIDITEDGYPIEDLLLQLPFLLAFLF